MAQDRLPLLAVLSACLWLGAFASAAGGAAAPTDRGAPAPTDRGAPAPADRGAPAPAGSVAGSIVLEPMQQPPMAALYRTRTRAPVLEPDPPRAIVYLERNDGVYPPIDSRDVVTVSQRGYQFRPAVVPVPRGARVSFPNRDDEFHNVFSYSSVKRFDLGRFRKDEESPLVTFDNPGVVRVYCEIHKHMRSLLLVLDTPWHTATDAEGNYRLPDVPPGRYTLRAFLPSERILESSVTVEAGRTIRMDLGEP